MPTARKREWHRPKARPVTTADGRADVPDTAVRNGTFISTPN